MEPGGEGGGGGCDGGGLAGEEGEFGEAVGCGEMGVAEGGVDGFGEFGGVGGGEDENGVRGVVGAGLFGGEAADGGVGIHDCSAFAMEALYGLKGGGVVESEAMDGLTDSGFVVLEEVADALEVVGCSDVHGIGECGHGGAWLVWRSCEEGRDGVVAIGGGDPLVDREAEALGKDSGGEVAKVAAGHDEDRRETGVGGCRLCFAACEKACGFEIIECLRKEAGKVD